MTSLEVSDDLAPSSTTLQPLNQGLLTLLCRLLERLSQRRRLQLASLFLVMLASSVAEVVSLASVVPFLAVLTNPEVLWKNPLVQEWVPRLGINSAEGLMLPTTVIFVVAALVAGVIRLLNLWLNGRLAAVIGSDLSCEAYRRTLYQPYAVHLRNNSSRLITTISSDVITVISGVLNPILLLLSSGLIAAGLVITLLVIEWSIAISTGLLIFLLYLLAMAWTKGPLQRLGQLQVLFNERLIQSIQEGLGAIREVLLDGRTFFYESNYSEADRPMRHASADAIFLSSAPRLVLEPVGIALIAFVGYMLVRQQGVDRALPLLAPLALGAQRLLPMAQKVYEGWAQSRAAKGSLAKLLQLLDQPLPENTKLPPPDPLLLQVGIRFSGVRFRYGSDLPEILQGLDFEIRRGERIGIIGSTGSGKSTTLDLLMGLLEPTVGQILVDGESLHSFTSPARLEAWRAAIGHVPQSVYLADRSFAENIAFGVPVDQIDQDRVKLAAKQAQIAAFIESQPNGYSRFVGERGIRLSGGQRQRIGIARALYKQSKVLVFDEATSALDMTTEKGVIQAIEGLSRDLTIVMIAHRLSTLKGCDRIISLDKGVVQFDGRPADVLDSLHN